MSQQAEQPTLPHHLNDPGRHPAWSPENEDEARFVARLTLDLCIAQLRANNGLGRSNVPGTVTEVIGTLQEARRQTARLHAGSMEIVDRSSPAPAVPQASKDPIAVAVVMRRPAGWAIVCRSAKVGKAYEFLSDGETAEFAVALRDEGNWTLSFDVDAVPVAIIVKEIDDAAVQPKGK